MKYKLGKQWGIHRFLYTPNSSWALLGRDLLEQLGAEIVVEKGKMKLRIGEEQLINVLSLALIQTDPKSEIPLEITDQYVQEFGLPKSLEEQKCDLNNY